MRIHPAILALLVCAVTVTGACDDDRYASSTNTAANNANNANNQINNANNANNANNGNNAIVDDNSSTDNAPLGCQDQPGVQCRACDGEATPLCDVNGWSCPEGSVEVGESPCPITLRCAAPPVCAASCDAPGDVAPECVVEGDEAVERCPAGAVDLADCTMGMCDLVDGQPFCCDDDDVPVTEAACVGDLRCPNTSISYCATSPLGLTLGGTWRESAWIMCDGTLRTGLDDPIAELTFNGGEFGLTYSSGLFETYRDYWGTYAYDSTDGRLEMEVESGNFIPEDLDLAGYTYEGRTEARLVGMWLGRSGSGVPPDELPCGHILQRQ